MFELLKPPSAPVSRARGRTKIPHAMRACAISLCLVAACADEPAAGESGASWPPGTVVAVDGQPVLAAEVEPVARAIGELYPQYTEPHRRRLALTNVNLPRAAARARFPAEREAARAACERARDDGDAVAGAREVEADWKGLGLDLWIAARGLEIGAWSEPLELVGRFARLRVRARSSESDPRAQRVALSLVEFPYAGIPGSDLDDTVAEALAQSRLEIVDPDWSSAVPEEWKYRMRGTPR